MTHYKTCCVQDVPLISNVGCDFTIKPINYFEGLASMDVADSDAFESCAASQGAQAFDYAYSTEGANQAGNKAGFKVTGPLSSRDIFQATPKPENPLLAPDKAPPKQHAKRPSGVPPPYKALPVLKAPPPRRASVGL